MTQTEIQHIKQQIIDNPDAKIYLGSDSQRIKGKTVKFATVLVLHYFDGDTGRGANVFADVSFEDISDTKLNRPFNRMMMEVHKVTELYQTFEDVLIEKDFEIHIDVSPEATNGSSVAYNAARGVIWGLIGVEPICKPEAFAASAIADRWSK